MPTYREDREDAAIRFGPSPGTASYIPALGAHWQRSGAERSAAYGFNVRTPVGLREKHCHALNRRLGSLGVAFSEFGFHRRRDCAKAALERWMVRRAGSGESI